VFHTDAVGKKIPGCFAAPGIFFIFAIRYFLLEKDFAKKHVDF
jgi:hypothetical protein